VPCSCLRLSSQKKRPALHFDVTRTAANNTSVRILHQFPAPHHALLFLEPVEPEETASPASAAYIIPTARDNTTITHLSHVLLLTMPCSFLSPLSRKKRPALPDSGELHSKSRSKRSPSCALQQQQQQQRQQGGRDVGVWQSRASSLNGSNADAADTCRASLPMLTSTNAPSLLEGHRMAAAAAGGHTSGRLNCKVRWPCRCSCAVVDAADAAAAAARLLTCSIRIARFDRYFLNLWLACEKGHGL
jgi:hypothetical protein